MLLPAEPCCAGVLLQEREAVAVASAVDDGVGAFQRRTLQTHNAGHIDSDSGSCSCCGKRTWGFVMRHSTRLQHTPRQIAERANPHGVHLQPLSFILFEIINDRLTQSHMPT